MGDSVCFVEFGKFHHAEIVDADVDITCFVGELELERAGFIVFGGFPGEAEIGFSFCNAFVDGHLPDFIGKNQVVGCEEFQQAAGLEHGVHGHHVGEERRGAYAVEERLNHPDHTEGYSLGNHRSIELIGNERTRGLRVDSDLR